MSVFSVSTLNSLCPYFLSVLRTAYVRIFCQYSEQPMSVFSVSTLNSLCPYFLSVLRTAYVCIFCLYSKQPTSIFSDFLPDFLADSLPISQNKTKSKVNFSIIHLVRTVCQLTSSIIRTHYTRTTLFCLRLQKF